MKYLMALILTATISSIALAEDQVPFGTEIVSSIKHYNRASPTVATSGKLSSDAPAELAAHGFATIIDLRTQEEGIAEGKAAAEKAGIQYINIPITSAGVNDEQLAEFTRVFESAATPILVHCVSGNRVGAMMSRYYLSKGFDKEIALERGRTAGLKPSLEEKVLQMCKSC